MRGKERITGPVKADLTAVMQIPISWSRKNREKALNGDIKPTSKPDVDNILKIALDSLNGIVYGDDKQVVEATIEKCYGEKPELIIRILEI